MSDLILDLLRRLTPSFESKVSSFLESGVNNKAKDLELVIPPTPPNSDL